MSDPNEFDRLHEEYLAFLDEGAGDYLQEHADLMADELGLDAADTVPIVGINPANAQPYIMTLAMVGYKKMRDEMFQVSVAWYTVPRLPVEIMEILNQDNVDIEKEDIVAHLLRKRLAIVALIDRVNQAIDRPAHFCIIFAAKTPLGIQRIGSCGNCLSLQCRRLPIIGHF